MTGQSPDDALLLIGHGSARYPDAGRVLHQHAEALRQHFAEVAVGFLNGEPKAADTLAAIRAHTVHIVPFFMEHGYFAGMAVPKALLADAHHALRYCPAVGTHEELADLIERRVQRFCTEQHQVPASLSVVVVGHGSARHPGRPMSLHRHAERLRLTGRFAAVETAFLEEPPLVVDTISALRGRPVAVVTVLAGDGMHARDDIPAIVATVRADHAHDIFELGSIGDDTGMAKIILDQVKRGHASAK